MHIVFTENVAYKVLTAAQWAAVQDGHFLGSPVDIADGFIHLSTDAQLTQTVDKHFAGQNDLIVAAIDLASLQGAVRWEASRQGQFFPHLYGRLEMRSVLAFAPLQRNASGVVKLPA